MMNVEVMSAEIFVLDYTAEDKTTWTIQADREWLEWDNIYVNSIERKKDIELGDNTALNYIFVDCFFLCHWSCQAY